MCQDKKVTYISYALQAKKNINRKGFDICSTEKNVLFPSTNNLHIIIYLHFVVMIGGGKLFIISVNYNNL